MLSEEIINRLTATAKAAQNYIRKQDLEIARLRKSWTKEIISDRTDADQSAEITRLKAEIERLEGESKDLHREIRENAGRGETSRDYDGEWEGSFGPGSIEGSYRIYNDCLFRWNRLYGGWIESMHTVDEFKLLIYSGAMKRVSKAEPNPLTSTGGSE